MIRLTLSLLVLLGGCSGYSAAQLALLEQARRGLAEIEQAHEERAALAQSHDSQRRAALDAAFDADARAAGSLDAPWVIEARKAYAAAIDALHARRAAAEEADRVTRSNFRATRAALDHLQRLIELPAEALRGEP
jgi:hypothetical protein